MQSYPKMVSVVLLLIAMAPALGQQQGPQRPAQGPPRAGQEQTSMPLLLLLAAGVPCDQYGIQWPVGLQVLPGAREKCHRIELLFQVAALQATAGRLNPRLASEIDRTLADLGKRLVRDHAERLSLTPAMYQKSGAFLLQLRDAVSTFSAFEIPRAANPYYPVRPYRPP